MNFDTLNFQGKKALVRVDFNVPLSADKKITDDTRIREALPTIEKILKDGGAVLIMSHLGRPKGERNPDLSLAPIAAHLQTLVSAPVHFCTQCVGEKATTAAKDLKMGEILVLENLRYHKEEEQGDAAFAKELSLLGDFYVNDAFGTAHRAHASTATIAANFPNAKSFGYLIQKELSSISKVLKDGKAPITAIIGGAKVSSKITIIENMMSAVDHIIIGGGMAFTFLKAKGFSVGSSLVEDDYVALAKKLIIKAAETGVKLHIPIDSICADRFAADANVTITENENVADGLMGLDIGPKTLALYKDVVNQSNTILWNGPMGVFEMEAFAKGTLEMALCIADRTEAGAFSVVGGGDSVAAVNKFNLGNRVSHVSTGGGAMLEYLEGKTLPGIQAILD